jgi:hypothetical protein
MEIAFSRARLAREIKATHQRSAPGINQAISIDASGTKHRLRVTVGKPGAVTW